MSTLPLGRVRQLPYMRDTEMQQVGVNCDRTDQCDVWLTPTKVTSCLQI